MIHSLYWSWKSYETLFFFNLQWLLLRKWSDIRKSNIFCLCVKVHKCNKLASRHLRVGLADPSNAPSCDICENAPGMNIWFLCRMPTFRVLTCFFFAAFFYCEIDGSSLCLQCDMVVHVGGKRTHRRFLLLRQRIEVRLLKNPGSWSIFDMWYWLFFTMLFLVVPRR